MVLGFFVIVVWLVGLVFFFFFKEKMFEQFRIDLQNICWSERAREICGKWDGMQTGRCQVRQMWECSSYK